MYTLLGSVIGIIVIGVYAYLTDKINQKREEIKICIDNALK
ncbi:hypothetical protein EV294_105444 [Paenibacillus sp. BK033]|nr:hypothetical protein [Paenibacillus sp. BK720]TCM96577.1 hypothetical protein EV294_105444 [Paenibacillus sp. BK033]